MDYPTRQQVREFIRQSNLIEGISDPLEVKQSLIAWDYLMEDVHGELSNSVIRKVQKIITIRQPLHPAGRGYYRGELMPFEVTIGGRAGKSSAMVPHLMDNWLLDYKELGWKEAHVRFEHIHPFLDGNGRTGRMLMNWQRIRLEGLPLLTVYNKEKQEYYKWF
jgi:Fic family protein